MLRQQPPPPLPSASASTLVWTEHGLPMFGARHIYGDLLGCAASAISKDTDILALMRQARLNQKIVVRDGSGRQGWYLSYGQTLRALAAAIPAHWSMGKCSVWGLERVNALRVGLAVSSSDASELLKERGGRRGCAPKQKQHGRASSWRNGLVAGSMALDPTAIAEVATEAGMKPGHKRKFVSYLSARRLCPVVR